jgi:hypothetical protein
MKLTKIPAPRLPYRDGDQTVEVLNTMPTPFHVEEIQPD